ARPDLPPRHQLIALADAADAKVVELRTVADGGRVDRGAAARAEALRAFVSALRRLHVDRGLATGELEGAIERRDRQPKRRARQRLAVGAVADRGTARIDLGLVADVTAMAAAVDFHESLPSVVPPAKR